MELFEIFAKTREVAIENFQISEHIREKYNGYDMLLNNLESFIQEKENELFEINRNLAVEKNQQIL